MKKNVLVVLLALICSSAFAQVGNFDDYVNLNQDNQAYPGFISYSYRGLHPVGHAQFKMFNYGGTPNAKTALGSNETLGSYVFNGYDGTSNVISAVIQARTITDSRDPSINFLLSNGVGNQRPIRMTIVGQSGNMGIGVTAPTEKLDVNGNIRMRSGAMTGYIPVSDADGKMTWTDPVNVFSSPWDVTGNNIHKLTGRVGIGTETPLFPLSVRTGQGEVVRLRSDSTRAYIGIGTSAGMIGYVGSYDNENDVDLGTGYDNLVGNVSLTINGLPRLTVIPGGKVGIGTGTPTQKLDVTGRIRMRGGAMAGYIPVADADGVMTWTDPNTVLTPSLASEIVDADGDTGIDVENSADSDNIRFSTTGSTRMILTDIGRLGWNKNTPASDMHIKQSQNTISGGTGGLTFEDATTLDDTWRVYHSGIYLSFNKDDDRVAYINDATGAWTQDSDINLKKDIAEMPSVLDKVMELRPVSYRYKRQKDGSPTTIGLIAQEAQPLFPEMVHEGENGKLGMTYAISGVIAIKALQEQQVIIEKQAEEIAELKGQQERINQLEAANIEKQEQLDQLLQKFEQFEEALGTCCLNTDAQEKEATSIITLEGNNQPSLEQNAPNPFYDQTEIRYYLPAYADKGQIVITDTRGAVLKTIQLTQTGLGRVLVEAGTLAPGTYAYTLYVNGNRISTKQMVLVK